MRDNQASPREGKPVGKKIDSTARWADELKVNQGEAPQYQSSMENGSTGWEELAAVCIR